MMNPKVHLYALSTCGWCKKTKRFLQDNQIDYVCDDMDLLSGIERERASQEMDRFNPRRSYPTIVIDGSKVIVGFDEDQLREALGL